MWHFGDDNAKLADSKSDMSCQNCRRRKIKCDRALPRCSVCEDGFQKCEYPSGPLKPGPKLGSVKRKRKSCHGDCQSQDAGPAPSAMTVAAGGVEQDLHRGSPLINHTPRLSMSRSRSGSEKEPPEPTASPVNLEAVDRDTQQDPKLNVAAISFILHPAHEVTTPEKATENVSLPQAVPSHDEPAIIAGACDALGISSGMLRRLVRLYFDHMVAINLFHQPTFQEKIRNVASPVDVHALLASMFTYSARFAAEDDTESANEPGLLGLADSLPEIADPAHFAGLARQFIEAALGECGDEQPSLTLLQALIISSHCQLTQGVKGRAWRSLGMCVRLAYELNLHLIDSAGPGNISPMSDKQWCFAEEKRRAWWAIWEMDVFASTVRRCPPAVDWCQIETLLPVEDEFWFQGTPRPSCFLILNCIRRWKELQECGNRSPKAWFIVINSLMKDAQRISCPRGVPNLNSQGFSRAPHGSLQKSAQELQKDDLDKLEVLSYSVRCFGMAVPPYLQYRRQFLDFGRGEPGQVTSPRQLHCGIYNIYVMYHLAQLMIHRYEIFRIPSATFFMDKRPRSRTDSTSLGKIEDQRACLSQYFEAADNIAAIIHRSAEDHIRHINPFLPSTIWLASAVQLVRKAFGPSEPSQSLINAKFEVLNLTYKRCANFWGIITAMGQNLESLDSLLSDIGRTESRTGSSKSTRCPIRTQPLAPKHHGRDLAGQSVNVASQPPPALPTDQLETSPTTSSTRPLTGLQVASDLSRFEMHVGEADFSLTAGEKQAEDALNSLSLVPGIDLYGAGVLSPASSSSTFQQASSNRHQFDHFQFPPDLYGEPLPSDATAFDDLPFGIQVGPEGFIEHLLSGAYTF